MLLERKSYTYIIGLECVPSWHIRPGHGQPMLGKVGISESLYVFLTLQMLMWLLLQFRLQTL